jgi:hypothetical protein
MEINTLTPLQRACAAAEDYLLSLLRSPEDTEAYERALDRARNEAVRLQRMLRDEVAKAKVR